MSTFTTVTARRRPFSEIIDEAIAAGEIVGYVEDAAVVRTSIGTAIVKVGSPVLAGLPAPVGA